MVQILLCVLSFVGSILYSDEYSFRGKHFVASYIDCDLESIADLDGLIHAMDRAVLESGATVLDRAPYVFPPSGLTIVYLLSESHASLHTYPEHGSCFVDLFTCGDTCSSEKFDEVLRDFLKPQRVNARIFMRSEEIEEVVID